VRGFSAQNPPRAHGGRVSARFKKAPREFVENARKALSLFASTSPSYIILQSLDLCNDYLFGGYRERLAEFIKKVENLKEQIKKLGFSLLDGEPLKLTVDAKRSGYSGVELAKIFERENVICEFADPDYTVFMLTPENTDEDLDRLASAFETIEQKEPIAPSALAYPTEQNAAISLREAILKKSRKAPLGEALGKICGAPTVACPPAVPIAVSGEVVSEAHLRLMRYYGIGEIEIID
jgi:arginine/lysine/ornithine decarboxylase